MRSLRLEKKGLRGLAIAESFQRNKEKSVLSGVVMRRDFLIDGFVFDYTTIGGDDATETILRMIEKLKRPDISYVMLSGIIISMYNIIDLQRIHESTKLPIMGITYKDSKGIEDAIKSHFKNYLPKLEQYKKIREGEKICLWTSYAVFVRRLGCSYVDVKKLLDTLTLQGSVPEPLRVAQLLANSIVKYF